MVPKARKYCTLCFFVLQWEIIRWAIKRCFFSKQIMFQPAVWTLKRNDAICHFLKEGFKHVSTNLSVLCPINSTFWNEINLSPVKAPTTISKPVKFACLLPPMACGKETVFSPGTISSTLHQVKFNCFHFLESLGISPVGGGAKRKSWKNTSVFNTLHLGSVSFLPLLLVVQQLSAGEATFRNLQRGKDQGSCWGEVRWHSKQ